MFTDFLWFLGAKQQYNRQKELGLAGLSGLLLAFFMVWKWDSIFLPLFDKLGFVAFMERFDLISDLPILTAINASALIFFLSLFIGLSIFLYTLIGCSLMVFGSSVAGKRFLGIAAFILFLPLIILFAISMEIYHLFSPETKKSMRYVYKHDPLLKPLLKEYKEETEAQRMFYLYKKQVYRKENIHDNFKPTDAKSYLNRAVASIKDDRNWLIGYDETDEQWHVLFPNPLPEFASPSLEYKWSKPYKAIFDYPSYDVKGFFVERGDDQSPGFFTPALPINFVWNKDKCKIEPRISSDAKISMKKTKLMYNYQIQSDEISSLFNSISEREDLHDWNRTSHVMLYMIPIVYPAGDPFSADIRFNNAVKLIPHTDTFRPLYASDVQDCLIHFAETGKDWAINWFKETV